MFKFFKRVWKNSMSLDMAGSFFKKKDHEDVGLNMFGRMVMILIGLVLAPCCILIFFPCELILESMLKNKDN